MIKYKKHKNRKHKKIKKTSVAICLFCIATIFFINNREKSYIDHASGYDHLPNYEDLYINPKESVFASTKVNDDDINTYKQNAVTANTTDTDKQDTTDTSLTDSDKQDTTDTSLTDSAVKDVPIEGLIEEPADNTTVPKTKAVGAEYFDDAVFIGNSHTEGITAYSVMDNATVYAAKGIMVDTIFTSNVIKSSGGKRVTIFDALASSNFDKVYILLGANELGWVYPSEFIKQYEKVIDKIREIQPSAKIYVQSILPVTSKKSSDDTIYNNVNIEKFNKLILEMSHEKEVYYLDIASSVSDDTGCLPDDVSKDGVHFGSKYYTKWFEYLKTHAI